MILLFLLINGPMNKVKGVTISCQTYGPEWATPGFEDTCQDLKTLGVNAVSIHPYARIRRNGEVSFRQIPDFVIKPQHTTQKNGLTMVLKPHLAYWGSGFSWRGDITFQGPELQRFLAGYRDYLLALVNASPDIPYLVIATELEQIHLLETEQYWRDLVAELRTLTKAKLGFAANWDRVEWISCWDAVDFIGVQAYFPLSESAEPTIQEISQGWDRVIGQLKKWHNTHQKPVLLTELGYPLSLVAAKEPWSYHEERGHLQSDAERLQAMCYDVALARIQAEGSWLEGVLLWKWFVGSSHGENFVLDTPKIRAVMKKTWSP